jgi:CelD/BcsL family acetyltransferase involved in cellulose biosynthesis
MVAASLAERRAPAAVPARMPRDGRAGEASIVALPSSRGHAVLGLVTTREELDALETSWNALFARAGGGIHLFQSFNWYWHWANHFLPAPGEAGPQLAIVTAHVGDRLVMVWPLVSDKIGPLTRLAWMGEPVSQYGDILIDDIADAPRLVEAGWELVTRRLGASLLQLRKVRADSVIAPLLVRKGARVTEELKAPYLDLASAASFADYEKRYSGNARRNRGRQRRRLAERGTLALRWLTGGPEAEALAAVALDLKQAWLRQRGIVSPAMADPRTAAFFADVTHTETHPAGCHVAALVSDGRPVALEIGVRAKDRTAIHVVVYDSEFEKTGAGSLLMEDSIRRAKDDGLAVFDMLAPGDGYKLEWADDAVSVRDWAVALSLPGYVYSTLYLGLIRRALKRGIGLLPLGARQKLAGAGALLRRA